MIDNAHTQALIAALQFQVESGVASAIADVPVDKTVMAVPSLPSEMPPPVQRASAVASEPMGSVAATLAACAAASQANTLEELEAAIRAFDGLAIRQTAMNCVFADGNPKADVMVIGEAPGADEDMQGKPFVGASGQLLDKVLSYIGLSRTAADPANAVYISNIVNWRPPGNRTPTPQEMDISLPFIERHIALVKPKILLLVGNVPMKSLLRASGGIMKMRGQWHNYPVSPGESVATIATFHPAFLLRSPNHKKTVWFDILALQQKREELGLCAKM
ncbi:MAG: uracil-DNA glycosylase [Pseudomonadota bacterium]